MQTSGNYRDVLGMRVTAFGWEDALQVLDSGLRPGCKQRIVNFLNANNANIAYGNAGYREALAASDMLLPDGIGMDIAAKAIAGEAFPANLNGTDFIPALLLHIDRPLRVALIGGSAAAVEQAAINFKKLAPWHEFRAISDGYFGEEGSERVKQDLAAFAPDFTLVAMGSPLQELWIKSNIGPEHGRLVMGVGALFDFVSGQVRRAPQWVRDLRFEWVFRLLVEPGRLWHRYIVGNPLFIYRVFRYRLTHDRVETSAAE
ncbi:glycosyltransferase [Pseudohoeflea suaedae]|uniref:Glycosyltransferase n=2 Tax=Pseudohoeflea suaedae TaxID=877384 RepID=A0A4R5PQJ0_9HYPH|nr:glycosyltransferase [Pseudohoeflea suaedae]